MSTDRPASLYPPQCATGYCDQCCREVDADESGTLAEHFTYLKARAQGGSFGNTATTEPLVCVGTGTESKPIPDVF